MNIQHRFIQNNGVRLHVAVTGTGPPIIFLHGFPEFWRIWRKVMQRLAGKYKCIAPDMRGFNLSAKPKEPNEYRLSFAMQDVIAVADYLGAKKFTLVAHDWGGIVSWRFAENYSERLHRLVILNAPHPDLYQNLVWTDPGQREAAQYAHRLANRDSAARFAPEGAISIWERLYKENHAIGVFDDEDKSAFLEAWSQPGAIESMTNWYRSGEIRVPAMSEPFSSENTRPIDSVINTPTLLLWGDRDPLFKATLIDELSNISPKLTVKHYADAGHGIVHEKFAAVAEEIDAFAGAP